MGTTSDFLGTKGIFILNEDEEEIKTLKQKHLLFLKPSLPYIVIDKLLSKKVKDKPMILREISLSDLKRKGFVLVSVHCGDYGKKAWITGQSNYYRIVPSGKVPRKTRVLGQTPDGHKIKWDNANNLILLEGRLANENNIYIKHI